MRKHSWKVWTTALLASLVGAGTASAQPTPPAPVGAPPSPAVPVIASPIEPGPIGPAPMSLPSPSGVISPLSLDAPPMIIAWSQQDRQERERDAERAERDRETRLYDQGRDDLDNARYDRAIQRFTDVAAMKGAHADAALYFKAWSQNKVGQRADALDDARGADEGLSEKPLSDPGEGARCRSPPQQRPAGTAGKRERRRPENLRLSALLNSDPEQAVPMLEKLLEGTAVAAREVEGAVRAGTEQFAAKRAR